MYVICKSPCRPVSANVLKASSTLSHSSTVRKIVQKKNGSKMKNKEFMVCALTEMSRTKDGSHGFDYSRFAPVVKVRTNYFRSHFFAK